MSRWITGGRTIRQVTNDVWLVVEEISEIQVLRDQELQGHTDLVDVLEISMNNGHTHRANKPACVTVETMIRKLFAGEEDT